MLKLNKLVVVLDEDDRAVVAEVDVPMTMVVNSGFNLNVRQMFAFYGLQQHWLKFRLSPISPVFLMHIATLFGRRSFVAPSYFPIIHF